MRNTFYIFLLLAACVMLAVGCSSDDDFAMLRKDPSQRAFIEHSECVLLRMSLSEAEGRYLAASLCGADSAATAALETALFDWHRLWWGKEHCRLGYSKCEDLYFKRVLYNALLAQARTDGAEECAMKMIGDDIEWNNEVWESNGCE